MRRLNQALDIFEFLSAYNYPKLFIVNFMITFRIIVS